MLEKLIAVFCSFSIVAGLCGQKLSKEEETLLDAMMFIFSKLEDNYREDEKSQAWRRTVVGKSIEFYQIGRKGYGSSDDEVNRKIRNSHHMKQVYRISAPEPCVFMFEEEMHFSKGDSLEDFSAYKTTNDLNTHVFNIRDAHKFELDDEDLRPPVIIILGPRAECSRHGYCDNVWNSAFSGLELGRMKYDPEETKRRKRAIEFVKKSCPGKPF